MSAGPEDAWLADALAALRAGNLVPYPTETLWGVAADAQSESGVAALRHFKGARGDKPFSVLAPDPGALEALGFEVGEAAAALVSEFWPGPLTLVLPCRAPWARRVGRADGAVAVRCSPHPQARALAAAAARNDLGPVTSTSLNRSDAPPARTRDDALAVCRGAPELLSLPETGEAGGQEESSIVDLSGAAPALLREGALAATQLGRWVPAP